MAMTEWHERERPEAAILAWPIRPSGPRNPVRTGHPTYAI